MTLELSLRIHETELRYQQNSRVDLTIDSRQNALTVPSNAVVDVEGKTGVFVAGSEQPQQASNPPPPAGGAAPMTAKFLPVQIGIRDGEQVEITAGLEAGARVVTTGATALKDGDRIVAANTGNRSGERTK